MSKVTDEGVSRALWQLGRSHILGKPLQHTPEVKSEMRSVLEAALSEPPKEPEICVTGGMRQAAERFFQDWYDRHIDFNLTELYRAMRALEPGVCGAAPEPQRYVRRSYSPGMSVSQLVEDQRKGPKDRRGYLTPTNIVRMNDDFRWTRYTRKGRRSGDKE